MLSTALVVTAARAWRGAGVQDAAAGARQVPGVLRLAMIAREATTRVGFAAIAPFGFLDARTPDPGIGRPVLIVPHPGRFRVELFLLRTMIARRTGRAVWAMRLPGDGVSLAEQADRVLTDVRRLQRWTGAAQVDVVGFGAGALAAVFCAGHVDDSDRIARVVGLGAPWRGTRTAPFAGPGGRDLAPDAPALDALFPCPVPVWSVWCPDDPEVVPAHSAVADPDRSIAVDAAGHVGLLVSARAMRAVLAALDVDDRLTPAEAP